MVVKVKVFKVLRTDSAFMKWPFFGRFLGAYSNKYGPKDGDGPKVCTFGLTLATCFPLKMTKIEKDKQ